MCVPSDTSQSVSYLGRDRRLICPMKSGSRTSAGSNRKKSPPEIPRSLSLTQLCRCGPDCACKVELGIRPDLPPRQRRSPTNRVMRGLPPWGATHCHWPSDREVHSRTQKSSPCRCDSVLTFDPMYNLVIISIFTNRAEHATLRRRGRPPRRCRGLAPTPCTSSRAVAARRA